MHKTEKLASSFKDFITEEGKVIGRWGKVNDRLFISITGD